MAELAIMAATSMGASAATAATIGTVVGYTGTALSALSALSSYQEGRAQSDMYKATAAYNAKVAAQEAKAEMATASRAASEERRKANILIGDTIAQAGKSGAIDPTTINIIGDIAKEGDLRARTKMFEGADTARKIRQGSDLDTWTSINEARSARRKGISTAMGTGISALNGLKG